MRYRVGSWLALALPAAVVAHITAPIAGAVGDELRSITDGAALMLAERIAADVDDDQFLIGLVSEDLAVPDDLVEVAWCANGTEWLRDFSLNLDIVVATDPGLVRAAELYATAVADSD